MTAVMTAAGAQVHARDLALAYRVMRDRSPSLKEAVVSAARRRRAPRLDQRWALDGVDLDVGAGEVVAVIGPNGAGKSTLLKVLGRVLPPTRGRVVVRGVVAPMIELGAGFNPELTGRENVLLYGALLGRPVELLRRRTGAIAEWADLADAMSAPVRTFSSGMVARLAFAIATDTDCDVLLVDEVLSVGDESFRRRAEERVAGLINSGGAVVLVSHAMDTVRVLAHRALWLEHGRPRMTGTAPAVVAAYLADTVARDAAGA